ncbi:MAG: helix-turn-helix domain-containing protein [Vulcanimicrobiota bacterium]
MSRCFLRLLFPFLFREERKKLGLTQSQVAERINKSYRSVQNVERHKRSPTLKTLQQLARAMGKKLNIELI